MRNALACEYKSAEGPVLVPKEPQEDQAGGHSFLENKRANQVSESVCELQEMVEVSMEVTETQASTVMGSRFLSFAFGGVSPSNAQRLLQHSALWALPVVFMGPHNAGIEFMPFYAYFHSTYISKPRPYVCKACQLAISPVPLKVFLNLLAYGNLPRLPSSVVC